jgi:hypothetical protein
MSNEQPAQNRGTRRQGAQTPKGTPSAASSEPAPGPLATSLANNPNQALFTAEMELFQCQLNLRGNSGQREEAWRDATAGAFQTAEQNGEGQAARHPLAGLSPAAIQACGTQLNQYITAAAVAIQAGVDPNPPAPTPTTAAPSQQQR